MALTIKQIEEALRANGGFVSKTAIALNVTQSNIYDRIKKSKELQKVKLEIDESFLDLAENQLIKKIKMKDLGAICFYLKCKGKGRGYVEKPVEDKEAATSENLANALSELIKKLPS